MLIAARRNWARPSQLATAFGVSRATLTNLINLNSRSYKQLHAELDHIGLKAFSEKYFDQELANQLHSFLASENARVELKAERNRQLWFSTRDGDRYNLWLDGAQEKWFYALHTPGEGRSKHHEGPFDTYEETVATMKEREAFDAR
jgi:hypothetical protein